MKEFAFKNAQLVYEIGYYADLNVLSRNIVFSRNETWSKDFIWHILDDRITSMFTWYFRGFFLILIIKTISIYIYKKKLTNCYFSDARIE